MMINSDNSSALFMLLDAAIASYSGTNTSTPPMIVSSRKMGVPTLTTLSWEKIHLLYSWVS